jgi:hypothetical protein
MALLTWYSQATMLKIQSFIIKNVFYLQYHADIINFILTLYIVRIRILYKFGEKLLTNEHLYIPSISLDFYLFWRGPLSDCLCDRVTHTQ